jgi:tetratricopeptide (TPR) repeat protein
VDVAELKKKFPPGVIKEYEAGKKAEQRGEMDAAVRLYQAALYEAPDFYPALNNLGIHHLQKGEVKAAETEFRRVIELNQNGAQAYFNLGNVLYMTKRNEEAKRTLEAGLRLSPSSAMGHYLNGSVLARLGDFKAAEEQLKAARALDPRMPQVTISLATLYLQSGREPEAAAMFEVFLKEFPKDPLVPKVRAALSKMAQSSSP